MLKSTIVTTTLAAITAGMLALSPANATFDDYVDINDTRQHVTAYGDVGEAHRELLKEHPQKDFFTVMHEEANEGDDHYTVYTYKTDDVTAVYKSGDPGMELALPTLMDNPAAVPTYVSVLTMYEKGKLTIAREVAVFDLVRGPYAGKCGVFMTHPLDKDPEVHVAVTENCAAAKGFVMKLGSKAGESVVSANEYVGSTNFVIIGDNSKGSAFVRRGIEAEAYTMKQNAVESKVSSIYR